MDAYILPEGCEFYCEDCAPEGAEAYPDGGGEADSPQHCGNRDCQKHLGNPLTSDGIDYCLEALTDYNLRGYGCVVTLTEWAEQLAGYGLGGEGEQILMDFEEAVARNGSKGA